jgi:ABC-type oligopeptide transport system substrate-binding subunit
MTTTMRLLSTLLLAAAFAVPAAAQTAAPAAPEAKKVLRYAFPVAETGFDPARVVDLYSRIVTAHIFESL